jgi:hypothetical protein
MGLDLVIGSDGALPLGGRPVIPVNPADPDRSASLITARCGPVAAVIAADTPMLELAAAVSARLGLPHNPAEAVRNAADKARQRQRWAAAGLPQPRFEIIPAAAPAGTIRRAAETVGLPCVVKAISLSASQGVLRADDPAAAVTAARRIREILTAARRPDTEPLLIEEYLPGPEISIDGLVTGDGLTVTAVFDKPAMPDGPTFEETLLVTPSQLPRPGPGVRHRDRRAGGPRARPHPRAGARGAAHRRPRHPAQARHARTGGTVHRRPVLTRAALPRRPDPRRAHPGQRPRPPGPRRQPCP